MTDKKRNSNPFIRMAQKATEAQQSQQTLTNKNDQLKMLINTKAPKPTPGFGSRVVKKTGRA
jgi:hypothetical protein